MVRKHFYALCVLFFSLTNLMAQEQDPWVGTWTSESYSDMDWENSPKDSEGTYQSIINTDYKLIIRITKNANQYNVRAKTIKVNDSNYSSYHNAYTVTNVDQNTMWLEQFIEKKPFYSNGVIDEYSDMTKYTKLSLNNGVLHYSYYKLHVVDYDKNKRYKGEKTYYEFFGAGAELNLFNDDW